MVGIKVFALLFALGAIAQAAPSHDTKDLRTVLENAIKIARIIGEAVANGIDDATPAIQAIEAEMNADLAAKVKGLLLRVKADIEKVNSNVRDLETAITDSIASIQKKAGKCQDDSETALKPILNKYGGQLAALITSIAADHRDELDSVYAGFADIGARLHQANIDGVKGGDACVVPGGSGIKECLDANGDNWSASLLGDLADAVLLLNEALPLANTTLTELMGGLQPGFNDTRLAADGVFVTFGTCVGGL